MLLAVFVAVGVALLATPAFAFDETTNTAMPWDEGHCGRCHNPWNDFDGKGVHGDYLSTTTKCASCHDVHAAGSPGSIMLLPAETIKATCYTCHDGTQGRGVYGAVAARGFAVGAAHRCETTTIVPGGSASTGGSSTVTFGGSGGTLSCDDCHSPHDSNTVTGFPGDRNRNGTFTKTYDTNRLLKQRPGDATTPTPVYGSDWCGACHKGRLSGTGLHNHPVDSTATAGSNAFNYGRVARVTGAQPSAQTTIGPMGRFNSGYLMPMPRTAEQAGHAPICQQCHEDPRYPGTLDANGRASATAFILNDPSDGVNPNDSPRLQTFPHETTSTRFLLETNDDLCMNCHPPTLLP